MDNLEAVLARSRTSKRHYALILLVVLLFGGLFYTGYRPWKARQNRLLASSVREPALVVSAVKPVRAEGPLDLTLPAELAAVVETPIYARADGYIKTRSADIGDRVKAGQLLAEIDTPELDEQLSQSRYRYNQFMAASGATKAALVKAKADLALADVNLKRTEKLVKEGILATQEYDEKKAIYDVRAAEVSAAEANVKAAEEGKRSVNSDIERLLRASEFKRVNAPFDGVITSRSGEVGNLINAAAIASGRELFRLSNSQTLKALIHVPQTNAPSIRIGMPATITVAEFAGRKFTARVTRTASAIETSTRTLPVEVQLDNTSGALLPGMFAQVSLAVARTGPALTIRGDTAVVRADGTYVAVAESDGRVRFQKLTIGRDLGSHIEVIEGLRGDERLIVNPNDDIRDGVKVTAK